jgi:hypothetical protein
MTFRSSLTPWLLLAAATPLQLIAQTIQVTSANPNSYSQGTINLDVAIGGSNFGKGAKSQFLVTGTTNSGGVTVNSTTYVSSSQVNANITVSSTAVIGSYDIVVTNTNGRSGKGTGLAKVNAATCTVVSPAVLNTVRLNDNATYTGLGASVRARPLMQNGAPVALVVAVGTIAKGGNLEIFFLDANSGAVIDGTTVAGISLPHITIPVTYNGSTFGMKYMAIGDLNGDGIPDIAIGKKDGGAAFAFVGSVSSNTINYSKAIPLTAPTKSAGFGVGVAMGNLDNDPGDEIAVADQGSGTGNKLITGATYVFKFNGNIDSPGFSLATTINTASVGVAIGDVSGDGYQDLIVGTTGTNSYIYPGPLTAKLSPTLVPPYPTVRAARVNGPIPPMEDLILGPFVGVAGTPAPPSPNVEVFQGPITNQAPQQPEYTFSPEQVNDMDTGDVNGDGYSDILVGAPNASCPAGGTAYVYLSNPPAAPNAYQLQTPAGSANFGWAVAAVHVDGPAPTSFVLATDNNWTVNGVVTGQVYVYKLQ